MRKVAITALTTAFVLASTSAFANHHEEREAKFAEHFAAMDTDGNGTVSEEEYVAAAAAKASKKFAKIAGDDGELTLDEAKAAKKKKHKKKKAKREGGNGS